MHTLKSRESSRNSSPLNWRREVANNSIDFSLIKHEKLTKTRDRNNRNIPSKLIKSFDNKDLEVDSSKLIEINNKSVRLEVKFELIFL